MSERVSSIALWAASKVIGRECSTENKLYFQCKKDKGENPAECSVQANNASECAEKIVQTLESKYPTEYKAFQHCLHMNDYRMGDCRETEKNLLDCWNNKK